MKRIIQYSAIIIALSLAASCNPIEDRTSEAGLISFEPQTVQTKALVNPENVTGEQFAVWDLLGNSVHLQNSIAYSGGKWVYQDPANATYYWADGTHKFFGYTHSNNSSVSFDQTARQWNIGSTSSPMTITTTANQTDLLYSDIFSTTAAAWKAVEEHTTETPVKLTFHHLLSAVRITMINASGTSVTVSSASVTIPNKRSASVSFSGSEAAVAYADNLTTDGTFSSFNSQTLSAGDSLDMLNNGAKLSAAATPYLIWPQTLVVDEQTGKTPTTIKFNLAFGNNTATEKTIWLPAGTWTAREINNYRLVIYPEKIILEFDVMPWQKETIDLATPTSINMTNVSWMNTNVKLTQDATTTENTVVNNDYSVFMYYQPYTLVKDEEHPQGQWTKYTANNGYYPAQGFFTVNYPVSGKFKISLIAARNETTVEPGRYEIYIYDPTATGQWRAQNADGETITRNTVYFQVRAAAGQDGAQHKAQIDIKFLPAGEDSEWISAYSEIRANYALIIPETN